MLEKIEDINLLNLAKDIKEMISDGKLNFLNNFMHFNSIRFISIPF